MKSAPNSEALDRPVKRRGLQHECALMLLSVYGDDGMHFLMPLTLGAAVRCL